MDLRRASKEVAHGRREKVLFAAVLFSVTADARVQVLIVAGLSLWGMWRRAPDPEFENRFVPDKGFSRPIAWWISGLLFTLVLVWLLFSSLSLREMFS
jgi:hypothetical protein